MKFTPLPNDDRAAQPLLPAGSYPFKVHAAKEAISKNGRDMISLSLTVTAPDGRTASVYDYLLEAMKFKLIHFCRGAGLTEKYATGELIASDCLGSTGTAELEVQEQDGYPPKNVVKDYVAARGSASPAPSARSLQPPHHPC